MAWREKIIEELLERNLTRRNLATELGALYETISPALRRMWDDREIEEKRGAERLPEYEVGLTEWFRARLMNENR